MKGTFTILKADGTYFTEELTATPQYEKIKAGLNDGWLELVPLFDTYKGERCVAFCDEEGREIKGLPRNPSATALWHAQIRARGYEPSRVLTAPDAIDGLVGPIVIITGDDALLRGL